MEELYQLIRCWQTGDSLDSFVLFSNAWAFIAIQTWSYKLCPIIPALHRFPDVIPDDEHAIPLIPDPFPSLFLVDNTYVCIYGVNKQLFSLLQLYLTLNKHSPWLRGGGRFSSLHWGVYNSCVWIYIHTYKYIHDLGGCYMRWEGGNGEKWQNGGRGYHLLGLYMLYNHLGACK